MSRGTTLGDVLIPVFARRYSLAVRLSVPLLVVAAVGLLAVVFGATWLTNRVAEQQISARFDSVEEVLLQSQFPLTDAVLSQMSELSGAEFVLADSNGRLLAASDWQLVGDPRDDHGLLGSADRLADKYYSRTVRLDSPVRPSNAVTSGRRVQILLDRQLYQSVWWSAFGSATCVGLLLVIGMLTANWLVVRGVRRSIEVLRDDMGRLAEENIVAVDLPPHDDEIRDIAVAINAAAEQLRSYQEELVVTERAKTVATLGAGLAHELRNSITGCHLAIDLMAEDAGFPDEDENFTVARRQLAAMERRLTELLQVGRPFDAEPLTVTDLGMVVRECIALLRPVARHHHIDTVVTGLDRPHWVMAHRAGLSQVVTNLVKNAIEASMPQRSQGAVNQIFIELDSDEREVQLQVANETSSPPNRNALNLFATTKPEGIGLGLPVISKLMTLFGGTLRWSLEDGFVRFECRFPACSNTDTEAEVAAPCLTS